VFPFHIAAQEADLACAALEEEAVAPSATTTRRQELKTSKDPGLREGRCHAKQQPRQELDDGNADRQHID